MIFKLALVPYGDSRNEAIETVVPKPLTSDIDVGQIGNTIVTPRNHLQNDVTNIGTGPQYHQPMNKSSHLGGPIPPPLPFVIQINNINNNSNSNGFTDVKGTACFGAY